jgi:hypothetical protein
MAQRSPYNDRYKTDQKGKTRKSASSAKPKREIADLTPARAEKLPAKRKGLFGGGRSTPRPAAPVLVNSPRMKQLRMVWWVLWIVALADALGILYLQKAGAAFANYIPIAWGVWLVAMGGAFYLEFLPIRKERAAMIEAAKAAKTAKSGKAGKAAKPGKGSKGATPEPVAPDDRTPPAPEDPA